MPNSSGITKTASALIKNLSPRNRDIISRRFGLKTGKKETLESIGKSYGITRERVRQIEEFSIGQLSKASAGVSDVANFVSLAKEILTGNSGVMRESEVFKAFSGNDKENVVNASLVFILTVAGEPVRFSENDMFHSFWSFDKQSVASFKENASKLVGALEKVRKPLAETELVSFAENASVSAKSLNVLLSVSKELGKNVFGEVGLISWSDIKPKGVRDKAYLVLKKENSPKHFGDIAKLINTTGFSDRKANTQTVHNELIKDSRFVLVGRGIYGLSEWGYRPGTVKEVLVDILRGATKPLLKAELVAKVLDNRIVKENTILLNLQDSKVFSKKDDGTYALRKA
jgi:hypothetical protein